MMKQTVEFKRIRDFGEVINDTFVFLKQNFKPLMLPVIIICGFFVLLGTITESFAQMNIVNLTYSDNMLPIHTSSYYFTIIFNVLVFILFDLAISMVTYCYISIYVEYKGETPALAQVWGYFKYYFFRAIGSWVMITLLFSVSLLLCIIPFIYLFPIFSLIIPIVIFENASFRYAFNKSFRIIKENWWTTFGVIIILLIILWVAGAIASIPISLIVTLRLFLSLKTFTLPLVILLSLLLSIMKLLYVLPAIGISFCYFSLNEQKDATGLMERIESLGKPVIKIDNPDLPTEEY